MQEEVFLELKKLQESIERQHKLIKAISIYNDVAKSYTETELKKMGRWAMEDPN